ncbi:hypothetical protein O6H91_06G044200 [Diphasiastrum complanatum]|uniref:Uncharacterized protein n=1 Tax=Diphasiastrum complanatum TaxID=34168 RepID=A0ACC2DD07_DIPCM|nr:hypothetical protein O6H91_06G044200 [Diphasiastrum complanatum]
MNLAIKRMDLVIDCNGQCSSPRIEPLAEDQSYVNSEELSSGRVKLVCSYGGRILPRPRDYQLRYVGGETRILGISRNILFADLMSKLGKLCGTSVVPKYQLPYEDLDVLVSISSDEDLDIMMEEFEKQINSKDGSSRIRVFLFTAKQQTVVDSLEDPRNPEQRFLDAVNGVSTLCRPHTKSFTFAQVPDYLFGLEGLTNQDQNSAALSSEAFAAQYTFSPVQSSTLDKRFAFPLHSIACCQLIASLPRQETSSERQLMLHPTSVTEKWVISDSFITTRPESSSRDTNQLGAPTVISQDHDSFSNAQPNYVDPNSVDKIINQDTCFASAVQFNSGLIVEQQHKGMRITRGVIDHPNLDLSSGENWNSCENQGKKMLMQRTVSDPNLSSDNRIQKLPSLNVSSNTTSGSRHWRADDDQQQFNERAVSKPPNLVLLPRPASTQLPAPSMHRIASAPNVMRAGDTFPAPCCIAPPHPASQPPRTYDQQLPTPQRSPTTPRSSRATHQSPRFRDLPPAPEFQEQPTNFRHQNTSGPLFPHLISHTVPHSHKPSI